MNKSKDDQQSEDNIILNELDDYAFDLLYRKKKDFNDAKKMLIKKGLDDPTASGIIWRIQAKHDQKKQEVFNELISYAKKLLFINKKSPDEVMLILKKLGLSKDAASTIVNRILKAKVESAQNLIKKGVLALTIGVVTTWATHSISSYTGLYVVAWGATLSGFVMILTGLAQLLKSPKAKN